MRRFNIGPIPIDEAGHAFGKRRARAESNGRLELSDVRAGFQHVARLHRQRLPKRSAAGRLFDEAHQFVHLDRSVIAEVVDPPGRKARCGIRFGDRPAQVGRRGTIEQLHDSVGDIVDVSEIALQGTALEKENRLALQDSLRDSHTAMSGRPHGP